MNYKRLFYLFGLVILCFNQWGYGVERIQLTDGTDFSKKMIANNVFLKWCNSIDADNEAVYFLDKDFSMVFKVDIKTGKLIKTISSMGQGKFELQSCNYIRVKNKKIYVLDLKFNGIKIFDTNGKGIKELKPDITPARNTTIDINEKDEIFMGVVDYKNNTLVSVYNLNGIKSRSLIPLKNKDDSFLNKSWYYMIKLDNTGNIYVMYYLERLLEKYDPSGKLLWQKQISNKLLDRQEKNEAIFVPSEGRITVANRAVFNIDITPLNNVIIGHTGGGCIISSDGDLKSEIQVKIDNKAVNLEQIKIIGNCLINVSGFGEISNIYPLSNQ